MEKLLKKLAIYAALAIMVASTSLAYAEPMRPEHEGKKYNKGNRGEQFQGVMDQLDLTQEQKDQLKAHREAQKEKTKDLREELNANRKALHEELKKYDSDKRVVDSTVAKINDIQGKLTAEGANNFMGMKKILTPEQYQKMSDLKDSKRQNKEENKKGGKMGQKRPPKKD